MKTTKPAPVKEPTVLPYFRWMIALMLLFSALCLYRPHVPATSYSVFIRTWGFNHFTFYTAPVQLFIYALALLLIIPYTNKLVNRVIAMAANTIAQLGKFKVVVFIVLSLVSVGLFYLFKVKYFFLGDFNLRLEQIMKKQVLSTEYLTMKFLYYFSALGIKHGFTAYQMFAYYSCLAGGVFVFFCFLIANLLGKDALQKLFFFFAQISSALLLIFCGYIEIYATPVVFLIIYLYFALRYLKLNTGFYLVVLSLCVAIGSHLLSIALVPSVAVLWYLNNKSKFGFITAMSNQKIAGILALLVFIPLIFILNKGNSLVLPLTPPKTDYMTMFSFKHFWEFFNGQILACGLSFIFAFILLWKIIRRKIQLDSTAWFLLSASGSVVFVIMLLNLHRGSGDWDIMALPAISLNLLVAVLITIVYKESAHVKNYLLTLIIGINAIQAFLWIDINHTDKSIQKIDTMLATDPGTYYTRLPSLLQLGLIYETNKLTVETELAGKRACDDHRINDIRSCMFYGKKLLLSKKMAEAAVVFESVLAIAPFSVEPYFYLMEYYQKTKQDLKFLNTLSMLYDAFQQQPQVFLTNANVGKSKIYTDLFASLMLAEAQRGNKPRVIAIQNTLEMLKTKP